MSENNSGYALPPDKEEKMRRAVRLEWISIFFLLTIITVIALVMGASEAMKAVWVEDVLSLIPPVGFLAAAYFRSKAPDEQFPYGYRRAVLIAFLLSAFALLSFGLYILGDAGYKLILAEHPTIETMEIFGRQIWLGWLMIAALVYSCIPPVILGRMKLPLARELHDKALQTDADMNKGDWLTGIAGILGIVGIAYGFWWADSIAAGIISIEIIKDGVSNLKNSVSQLMNKCPSDVESKESDPINDKVQKEIENLDWVKEARVRLRKDGDLIAGEAFVVPRDEQNLMEKLKEAGERIKSLDWRINDFNIVPVRFLE